MPALLFAADSSLPASSGAAFRVLLYAPVGLTGVLVGLEIPLVMRLLQQQFRERCRLKELPRAQRAALLGDSWAVWTERVVAGLAAVHPDLHGKLRRADLAGHSIFEEAFTPGTLAAR